MTTAANIPALKSAYEIARYAAQGARDAYALAYKDEAAAPTLAVLELRDQYIDAITEAVRAGWRLYTAEGEPEEYCPHTVREAAFAEYREAADFTDGPYVDALMYAALSISEDPEIAARAQKARARANA